MKTLKQKVTFVLFVLLLILSAVILISNMPNSVKIADAASLNDSSLYSIEVPATYTFLKLNDTECSVQISNKAEATKAIIPTTTEIDGKTYFITEVAANGFLSCPQLKRVGLPSTVKKINNMAFANCPNLAIVVLSKVEKIGTNAFAACPKLTEMVIPSTVDEMGSYVFRNNNTHIKVRAVADGINWATNWNSNNKDQDVEYASKYVEPLIYEEIYSNISRSSSPVGYSVADGQPYGDTYYEEYGGNIYVPAEHPETGLPILNILTNTFSDVEAEKLIIEYSAQPITIGDALFLFSNIDSVVFNRPIDYHGLDLNGKEASGIFSLANINTIVLPNSIPGICDTMFNGCIGLQHVNFIEPRDGTREEQEQIVDNLTLSDTIFLPEVETLKSIGQSAFGDLVDIKGIVIPENVIVIKPNAFNRWTASQQIFIDQREQYIPNEFDKAYLSECSAKVTFLKYQITFVNKDKITTKIVKLNQPIGEFPSVGTGDIYHQFKGWFDENGDQCFENTLFTYEKDIIITAKWIDYYRVTIINGNDVQTYYVKENDIFTLPTYYKEGYTGYFKYNYSRTRYFGQDVPITIDSTFEVVWEELPLADCYDSSTRTYLVYGPNQLRELNTIASSRVDVRLMNDIDVSDQNWTPITNAYCSLDGRGYSITFKNLSVTSNFGFFGTLNTTGSVSKVNFKALIKAVASASSEIYVGVIAAINYGSISDCTVSSYVGSAHSYTSMSSNNVDILVDAQSAKVGGAVGLNEKYVESVNVSSSIASSGTIGGIVGVNKSNVAYCRFSGTIYYDHYGKASSIGGIAGVHYANHYISDCENRGTINFKRISSNGSNPYIGQIVGCVYYNYSGSYLLDSNTWSSAKLNVDSSIPSSSRTYVKNSEYAYAAKA